MIEGTVTYRKNFLEHVSRTLRGRGRFAVGHCRDPQAALFETGFLPGPNDFIHSRRGRKGGATLSKAIAAGAALLMESFFETPKL
jgi:hypothetical protein